MIIYVFEKTMSTTCTFS